MSKTALFDSEINEKCCSVDGGWGICSLFRPTLGDLTAQESPPREFAIQGKKKKGWAQLESTDA